MKSSIIRHVLEAGIEQLSSIEHQRWSHWQKHLHQQGIRQSDGSLLLPANLVSRWERQMNTPYQDLDDDERESDRKQVRKYLPLICSLIENNKRQER